MEEEDIIIIIVVEDMEKKKDHQIGIKHNKIIVIICLNMLDNKKDKSQILENILIQMIQTEIENLLEDRQICIMKGN